MPTKGIIDAMSSDHKVDKFNGEKDCSYKSRLVYSSLAQWIKVLSISRSTSDSTVSSGASKSFVLSKGKTLLNEFTELFPEVISWFYPDSAFCPIEHIREILLYIGELVEVGEKTDIFPCSQRMIPINSENLQTGIVTDYSYGYASGLARFIRSSTAEKDYHLVCHYLNISCRTADELYNEYISKVKWERMEDTERYEWFDPCRKRPLSDSWRLLTDIEEFRIYIVRIISAYETRYRLVQKKHNGLYVHSINEHDVRRGQVQRFLYAQRYLEKNALYAEFRLLDSHCALTLHSWLPYQEDYVMKFIAWPENSITDRLHYVFRDELRGFVKYMVANLHIDIKEE